jgi:transcriptional regulator with XRE-family HTH domain
MNRTDKKLTEVGRFLRQLRFEQEESQEEMATRLGVTTPYISLLGAKQPMTKKLALKIIKEYNLEGNVKARFIEIVTRDVVRRFWG